MTHALLASMIYPPLRPLLRLWRVVVFFLRNFDILLEEQFDRYAYTAEGRRELEGAIAFAEDGINLMIYSRTCELLGLTPVITRGPAFHEPQKPLPLTELMARRERMLDRLRTFEDRAQLRAARIQRDMEQSPSVLVLRIDPPPPRSARWRQTTCARSSSRLRPSVRGTGGGGMRALARMTEGAATPADRL